MKVSAVTKDSDVAEAKAKEPKPLMSSVKGDCNMDTNEFAGWGHRDFQGEVLVYTGEDAGCGSGSGSGIGSGDESSRGYGSSWSEGAGYGWGSGSGWGSGWSSGSGCSSGSGS